MNKDFTTVTELPGDRVSVEQVERLAHRYLWAGSYCDGRDVLEVACGAGQGLGYLASVSASVRAGDISPDLVALGRGHYGTRVEISEMDACLLPLSNASVDIVLIFEAIYYLPSADRFVSECRRVLRPGGKVLVVTANKDLYDFNPSPFSFEYFGVVELGRLFAAHHFDCDFYGVTSVDAVSLRQRMLRPIKRAAVALNLIPRTMAGKRTLKRLVFGKLVQMPAEVTGKEIRYSEPTKLEPNMPDTRHKVIYMTATAR